MAKVPCTLMSRLDLLATIWQISNFDNAGLSWKIRTKFILRFSFLWLFLFLWLSVDRNKIEIIEALSFDQVKCVFNVLYEPNNIYFHTMDIYYKNNSFLENGSLYNGKI